MLNEAATTNEPRGRTTAQAIRWTFAVARLLSLALVPAMIGCSPGSGSSEPTTEASEALYRTGPRWPTSDPINICYTFPPNQWFVQDNPATRLSELEIDRVNRIIRLQDVARHYVEDDLQRIIPLRFRGWEACNGSENSSWIRISLTNTQAQSCIDDTKERAKAGLGSRGECWSMVVGGVGQRTDGQPRDMFLDVVGSTANADTTIHEFLHALGYSHEFERLDYVPPEGDYVGIPWLSGVRDAAGQLTQMRVDHLKAGSAIRSVTRTVADPLATWDFLHVGPGLLQIQLNGGGLCITAPSPPTDGDPIGLLLCNPLSPPGAQTFTFDPPKIRMGRFCFRVMETGPQAGRLVNRPCTAVENRPESFRETTTPGACVDNLDCTGPAHGCVKGRCVHVCTTDADCGESGPCSAGQCAQGFGVYDTPSDYDSLSNYGNGWGHQNAKLAPWDVVGLQRAYGKLPTGSIVAEGGRCLTADSNGFMVTRECLGNDNASWRVDKSGLVRAANRADVCLNISGGNTTDAPGVLAPNLIRWGCSTSFSNERFRLSGVELHAMGNLCVSATASADGAQLTTAYCDPNDSRQKWDFLDGFDRMRLSNSNFCVALPSPVPTGSETPIGTIPVLRTCAINGNCVCGPTDCTCSPAEDATQRISLARREVRFSPNRCFNVSGGVATPGQTIGLWNGCGLDVENNLFSIRGPLVEIRPTGPGQCVTATPYREAATMIMARCNPLSSNQQWDYSWQ